MLKLILGRRRLQRKSERKIGNREKMEYREKKKKRRKGGVMERDEKRIEEYILGIY